MLRVARRDPGLALLAAEAFVLLIAARVLINVLPLRKIARHLGEAGGETTRDELPPSMLATRAAWAG